MWLEIRQRCDLVRDDETQHVIPWRVDVKAFADDLRSFAVGRILADELRPYEIREWGSSAWDAADADSAGLLAAYASVLDSKGRFRDDEFEAIGEPIVYMYRFVIHDDFAAFRLALLDCFCRRFLDGALILVQYHSTWLSLAEFELLGFRVLGPPKISVPSSPPDIDTNTRFMVRDNSLKILYSPTDYPGDVPYATAEHAAWVKSQGPWDPI